MHSKTFQSLLSMARRRQLRGRRGSAGFTLVELMIVVVIIGVLAAVGVPQYMGVQKRAKAKTYAAEALGTAKECASLQIEGDAASTVKNPVGGEEIGGEAAAATLECKGTAEVEVVSKLFPVAFTVSCPSGEQAVEEEGRLKVTVASDGEMTCTAIAPAA